MPCTHVSPDSIAGRANAVDPVDPSVQTLLRPGDTEDGS
jgi:hypothetical protein